MINESWFAQVAFRAEILALELQPPATMICWNTTVPASPTLPGNVLSDIADQLPLVELGMLEDNVPDILRLQTSERGSIVFPLNPPARKKVLLGPGMMGSETEGTRVSIPPDAPHRADGPPGDNPTGDQNWLMKSYS